VNDSVLVPKFASTLAANCATKIKHFYKSQTNSDGLVMPQLVINNFPIFSAFHSLQLNTSDITKDNID